MSKLVGARVIEPLDKRTKAEYNTIRCDLKGTCPILERGHCLMTHYQGTCPYGTLHTQAGVTRRSHRYASWVQNVREALGDVGWPGVVPTHLRRATAIGDWVWLPYEYLTLPGERGATLPFPQHSGIYYRAPSFLHIGKWTPDFIVAAVHHRPRYADHLPIADYMRAELPRLLHDVKDYWPELWTWVKASDPSVIDILAETTPGEITYGVLPDTWTGALEIEGKVWKKKYSSREVTGTIESIAGLPTNHPITVSWIPSPFQVVSIVDRQLAIAWAQGKNS